MSIKKFMLSDGEGDLEESELDSSGLRTIGYDDVLKRIQISNGYIIENLEVSGTIYGNGSGLTNISASQISGIISSVNTFNNIDGSGTPDDPIILKNNISLTSVTASFKGDGSGITGISTSQISNFNTAVDSRITNIPNSALQNNYITINSQSVPLGGVINIEVDNTNDTPTTVKFTKSVGTISVGDIVSVGASGLSRCNNSDNMLSNIIGVVYSSGSGEILVQVFGETSVSMYGNISTGSLVYAGIGGTAVSYDQLGPGDYVTQVGIVSGNGPGKIIIQPRIFGQL